MADLFIEMLNGTTNAKSVMDILFITIEIEADIDVQAVRVQSQSVQGQSKQWLIIFGATVQNVIQESHARPSVQKV